MVTSGYLALQGGMAEAPPGLAGIPGEKHPAPYDEQRTFELEGDDSGKVDDSKVVVINSTELRCHSIEMEVLEAEGSAVRRSTRTAARSATSRAHLTRKYRLPMDAEDAVLKACF